MMFEFSRCPQPSQPDSIEAVLALTTLALFIMAIWALSKAMLASNRGRARAKAQGYARDAMRAAVHPSCPPDAMLLSQEGDATQEG